MLEFSLFKICTQTRTARILIFLSPFHQDQMAHSHSPKYRIHVRHMCAAHMKIDRWHTAQRPGVIEPFAENIRFSLFIFLSLLT